MAGGHAGGPLQKRTVGSSGKDQARHTTLQKVRIAQSRAVLTTSADVDNSRKCKKNMDDYIKITGLENSIEAQLIESILSEKKIPHRIRSFHDTAYDGLFQFQKGWGELYAPLKFKGEILEIIENVRAE